MRAVFLDMGSRMYGDSIFLDLGGFTVLIDGGHPGDFSSLPRMVEAGTLTAKFALVSDPALRWPESGDTDAVELGEMGRQLLDVLGEELPDPALDRDGFDAALDVARDLKTRYRDMIATLKQRGTKIVRYQTDPIKPITDALKGRGVKIVGPPRSRANVTRCGRGFAMRSRRMRRRAWRIFICASCSATRVTVPTRSTHPIAPRVRSTI